PPAWRWSNPSIASQDPIDAALVPPLKRSRDVRHTLTALPALPQLSLLFRREPCPCMPLHSHTSSSAKIRRCCVDSLNSPPKADIDGTEIPQRKRRPDVCYRGPQRGFIARRLGGGSCLLFDLGWIVSFCHSSLSSSRCWWWRHAAPAMRSSR